MCGKETGVHRKATPEVHIQRTPNDQNRGLARAMGEGAGTVSRTMNLALGTAKAAIG
ncbi:hypothetical protein [Halogeometricum borinquense]|uniref:hypothetical protein n=1 Tax=Halogeometricum borinquense TaxID=60847 RepID=UPI0034430733